MPQASQHSMAHVIVAGHGRSGTNLALNLLDCSTETICRNEPNEIRGIFAPLGDGFFPSDTPEADAARLSTVLEKARFLNSSRDNPNYPHKPYVRHAGLLRLYVRGMNRLSRSIHNAETERKLPGLLCDPSKIATCLPIFKILLWPGRIASTHAHMPGQRVIHVVRDPATFLKSWFTRYVHETAKDPGQVFRDNLPSIQRIMPAFGQDSTRINAFSERNLLESELWRWRYMNETLYDALRGSDRYMYVLYSDLVSRPKHHAEQMMAFCGLSPDPAFQSRIGRTENIFKPSKSKQPDPDLITDVVETVMANSKLSEIFSEQQNL